MPPQQQNHSERAHAYLSASCSKRWINCPGSRRLEAKFPNTTSKAAAEGTFAHELSELLIVRDLNLHDPISEDPLHEAIQDKRLDEEFYSEKLESYCQAYTDYVVEQYSEMIALDPNTIILLEEKLDYSEYAKGGWGSGDVLIANSVKVKVIDLKFGFGFVDPINNSQTRLYGLGVLKKAKELGFKPETVETHIYQPRISNIGHETLSRGELIEWGHNVIKPAAKEALKKNSKTKAGEWCKYCKAAGVCKSLNETAKNVVDFGVSELMTHEQILASYNMIGVIKEHIEKLEAFVEDQAINHNVEWEGYKVVKSTPKRALVVNAEDILLDHFFTIEEITQRKTLPLGELQKVIKKEHGKEGLEDIIPLIAKAKPGKPILVPDSDKREPLQDDSAEEDFL